MIIVNTSHQSLGNENSYGELIVSTTIYNKNNFTHFFVHKHHEHSHKSFQNSRPHTQYFINQRSYLIVSTINRQKNLLEPFLDNLTEWIFAHNEVLKTSLIEKTGYVENGGKNVEIM